MSESRRYEVRAMDARMAQAAAVSAARAERFYPVRTEAMCRGIEADPESGDLRFVYDVTVFGDELTEAEARVLDGNR